MPFQANIYRILVGGPSDVLEYRKIATEVILRWNHDHADNGIVLLPGLWEDDTRPERGAHPQSIVNKQLVDRCDAMIAIFSKRLGTATDTHESGTVEEVERVHAANKEVMVYFYGGQVNQEVFRDAEYAKLQEYKEDFRKKNYVDSFNSGEDLARKLSSHLNKLVKDMSAINERASTSDAGEQATGEQVIGHAVPEVDKQPNGRDPFNHFMSVLGTPPVNRASAEQALEEYCSLDVTEDEKHRAKAYFRFVLLQNGEPGMLAELQAMVKGDAQNDDEAQRNYHVLGLAYDHLKNFRKSEEAYRQALTYAKDPEQRANLGSHLAGSLYNQGKLQDSVQLTESLIAELEDDNALATLYIRLAEIYQLSEQHEIGGLALQQALLHAPDRTDLYFSAARAFDSAGLKELSMLYYRTLLDISPNEEAALNNIGVAYDGMELDQLAVDSYRRAFELDNTLAGANLAYKFLNAGFAADAATLLEEAKALPEPHRNVFEAIATIGRKRDNEVFIESGLLKRGRELKEFFYSYTDCHFKPDSADAYLEGSWRSDAGELVTIQQSSTSITASWVVGKDRVSFDGTVHKGTAVLGEIKSKPEDKSIWSSTTTLAERGFLYLSEDGDTAFILGINKPIIDALMYRKTLQRE